MPSSLRHERMVASAQYRDGTFHNPSGAKPAVQGGALPMLGEWFFGVATTLGRRRSFLFGHRDGAKFRRVPRRVENLADLQLTQARLAEMGFAEIRPDGRYGAMEPGRRRHAREVLSRANAASTPKER